MAAHDRTLHETIGSFRGAQQRLKDREDALHLLLQQAPRGLTRTDLLHIRKRENIEDLSATFSRVEEQIGHNTGNSASSPRVPFYTLSHNYIENPDEKSRTKLWDARKFWKKPETEDVDPPLLSINQQAYVVEGFVPSGSSSTRYATAPQPRRPKPPQSSAIRSKIEVPIKKPGPPSPITFLPSHFWVGLF